MAKKQPISRSATRRASTTDISISRTTRRFALEATRYVQFLNKTSYRWAGERLLEHIVLLQEQLVIANSARAPRMRLLLLNACALRMDLIATLIDTLEELNMSGCCIYVPIDDVVKDRKQNNIIDPDVPITDPRNDSKRLKRKKRRRNKTVNQHLTKMYDYLAAIKLEMYKWRQYTMTREMKRTGMSSDKIENELSESAAKPFIDVVGQPQNTNALYSPTAEQIFAVDVNIK